MVDNLSTGYRENLNPKSKFFFGDIRDSEFLDSILQKFSFDCVIHLAALKSIEESNQNPKLYTENNILASINLIDLCISRNIDKFIFSSTAAVYRPSSNILIDELHELNPINHYGYTKMIVENYLRSMSDMKKIKFIAFRYFNAGGYSIKKDLIKFKDMKPQNLLPIIMEVGAGLREEVLVFGHDYNTKDGTCIRDYVHVLDIASAHIKGIEYLNTNDSISLNLSTSLGSSVLEVIYESQKVIGKKISYTFFDRRKGDPESLVASYIKAKEELGWKPQYCLEDIIDSMWMKYKIEAI